MNIRDIESVLKYDSLNAKYEEQDIHAAYTSDLLSDVIANAPHEPSVLITIQAHKNTLAVANLTGITAVIICNNREIPGEMVKSAEAEGIALFRTGDNQFIASCKVGALL